MQFTAHFNHQMKNKIKFFFVDDFVVLFKWTHAYLNKIAFHHRKKWRKLLKRKMRLYYQRIIFVSLTLFLLAFHYFHKKMEKFCFSRFHCTEKEYDYCKIRIKLHKKLPFALIYLQKKKNHSKYDWIEWKQ